MKVTNKIKALSTMTLAAATLFLAGCQAQSNTLTFTPQSPTASMNINQSAVVTVNTALILKCFLSRSIARLFLGCMP